MADKTNEQKEYDAWKEEQRIKEEKQKQGEIGKSVCASMLQPIRIPPSEIMKGRILPCDEEEWKKPAKPSKKVNLLKNLFGF